MHDAEHDPLCKIYQLSVPLLNYDLVEVLLGHVWWQNAAVSSREEEGIGELLLARRLFYLLEVLAQDVQYQLKLLRTLIDFERLVANRVQVRELIDEIIQVLQNRFLGVRNAWTLRNAHRTFSTVPEA